MSDHDQELRDRLRLKYIPFDASDPELVAEVERFLALSPDEQHEFTRVLFNEEYEFYNGIQTARALYKPPVDRDPGSITEEKVRAYPERYRW